MTLKIYGEFPESMKPGSVESWAYWGGLTLKNEQDLAMKLFQFAAAEYDSYDGKQLSSVVPHLAISAVKLAENLQRKWGFFDEGDLFASPPQTTVSSCRRDAAAAAERYQIRREAHEFRKQSNSAQ